ncbi:MULTISPECIES: hypothetical protein [unclassified Bradyrhizobium]|uniref:hypothetical protein n=1 Tax=unclassified Bradyrhizobium TaxID=2631580 RepID=UPI0028EA1287|nr:MULTISPECIES: hypothetical protein [unclassified Bradyrhizobium]
MLDDVDGRDKPGHDDAEGEGRKTLTPYAIALRLEAGTTEVIVEAVVRDTTAQLVTPLPVGLLCRSY